jgi:hypothetical protein
MKAISSNSCDEETSMPERVDVSKIGLIEKSYE